MNTTIPEPGSHSLAYNKNRTSDGGKLVKRAKVPGRSPVVGPSKPRLWHRFGAGLITGASDDDPSGIATYSQAGARSGFQLAWTLLFTFPLMVVIQAISARIGRTTGL